MNVRRATEADIGTLRDLFDAFDRESPEPPHVEPHFDHRLDEVAATVREQIAVLAEDDEGRPLGFALAHRRDARHARLSDLYVVPGARRRRVATALVRDVAARVREQGLGHLDLQVASSNVAARAVYERWGFAEYQVALVAAVDALEERLGEEAAPAGPTFGSIHVQTDDVPAVERAVRQFVPRLPGGSRGSVVSQPRNGWVAVYDDVCDRDPAMLRRLARELSDRMGAVVLAIGIETGAVVRFILYERGSIVDEYLSVQEYYGPLPPGDVIALQANPRVVARLTGADPAAVREAAVHGRTPADLPPPAETLAAIAGVVGIAGAEHGWADSLELPGAVRIDRA